MSTISVDPATEQPAGTTVTTSTTTVEDIDTIVPPERPYIRRRWWTLLIISLVLIFGGGLLAAYTQTGGGTIQVRDLRWMGSNGILMSGLLYIPNTATSKSPAPGIVAIHGYINSRETQDGFAIEFARRGYVVLAPDQTGHGYSDPPAFANGFGGPDSLAYLLSLNIVDKNNVALEGHSMGGWAVDAAAGVYSTSYKSMVLEGSGTGVFGTPPGTRTFPRNLAVVLSRYDEFSNLMWGEVDPKQHIDSPVPTGADVVNSVKLQGVFGISNTVQIGKIYGSIADGTARVLYQPPNTHPGDHISTEAIGYAIGWMQATLQGGHPLATSDQTWYWKEIGTLLALIGGIMFLFPFGALLLQTPYFSTLRSPLPQGATMTGIGWWIGAALMILIPAFSFFGFQDFANQHINASALFPQTITIGVLGWALGNSIITLVLFLIWHFTSNRAKGAGWHDYGITWRGRGIEWANIGKSLVLAVAIAAALYALLLISDYAFKTDFRFWVVAIKLMDPLQFRIFLQFLIPFLAYFFVLGMVLHGQMRGAGAKESRPSLSRALGVNVVLMAGGILLLILYQYIPLFSGNTLTNAAEALLSIVAFQFLVLLAIVGLISTYFFYKTGHIYVGAFLNAILITWIVVAGTATQFPLS